MDLETADRPPGEDIQMHELDVQYKQAFPSSTLSSREKQALTQRSTACVDTSKLGCTPPSSGRSMKPSNISPHDARTSPQFDFEENFQQAGPQWKASERGAA